MIKFRKVTESDEQLNSQIEALNRKVSHTQKQLRTFIFLQVCIRVQQLTL